MVCGWRSRLFAKVPSSGAGGRSQAARNKALDDAATESKVCLQLSDDLAGVRYFVEQLGWFNFSLPFFLPSKDCSQCSFDLWHSCKTIWIMKNKKKQRTVVAKTDAECNSLCATEIKVIHCSLLGAAQFLLCKMRADGKSRLAGGYPIPGQSRCLRQEVFGKNTFYYCWFLHHGHGEGGYCAPCLEFRFLFNDAFRPNHHLDWVSNLFGEHCPAIGFLYLSYNLFCRLWHWGYSLAQGTQPWIHLQFPTYIGLKKLPRHWFGSGEYLLSGAPKIESDHASEAVAFGGRQDCAGQRFVRKGQGDPLQVKVWLRSTNTFNALLAVKPVRWSSDLIVFAWFWCKIFFFPCWQSSWSNSLPSFHNLSFWAGFRCQQQSDAVFTVCSFQHLAPEPETSCYKLWLRNVGEKLWILHNGNGEGGQFGFRFGRAPHGFLKCFLGQQSCFFPAWGAWTISSGASRSRSPFFCKRHRSRVKKGELQYSTTQMVL